MQSPSPLLNLITRSLPRGGLLLGCWLAALPAFAAVPAPLPAEEAERLAAYLDAHAATPEDYILEKFRSHDVVLLGEDHRIKHNLELAQRLIPLLYRAGVRHFGMEFGASEDQAALDALVTAEHYDEAAARRLMFNYDVGWAFKEYMDIYRAAWRLNRSLPGGARKFRILNLSYKYDWSGYAGIRTPVTMARVFHRGNTETYRAALVRREILDRPGEKLLVLTGTVHAFTRYLYPDYEAMAPGFFRLEPRYFGNLLHRAAPGRVCFIALHRAFDSPTGGGAELVNPARGAIEQVMARRPGKRVGFDLPGTPLGDLPDDSYYAIGHPDFRLKDFAEGYIFEKPLAEFEGCTVDEQFLTEENWAEAKRQIPGELGSGRAVKTREEYLADIRAYADVARAYHRVH
jgi:hypothetical protein